MELIKIKNIKKDNSCDGCCYRKQCEKEIEKCQYLVKWRCMIKETKIDGENYGK